MSAPKVNPYSHIRGFNYQPSYGSHGLQIWGEKFDASKIEKELGLGKKYFPRMNSIRLWLSWDAFLSDGKRFVDNFETTLKIAQKNNLLVMPVLFNGWHSIPDFGGIALEQINCWGREAFRRELFLPYLEKIVGEHGNNDCIFMWDLCNEPFNSAWSSDARDVIFNWLKYIYNICKKLGAKAPICTGTAGPAPVMDIVRLMEPVSDVITIHPYWAGDAYDWGKKQFEEFIDSAVDLADQTNKSLLASETGFGSPDDAKRAESLAYELGELKKRGIGWLVHLLHHSLVADAHRPEFGPVSNAGNMSFIEADGSLRPYHEVFNQF